MATLIDRLYPLPDRRRTPLSLLGWWESRRWYYNRVVGTTGLITVAGVFLLQPGRWALFGPPLVGMVVVYGVLANVCYSLGWVVEMLARAAWGREAPDMGPLLFREGLVFSVVLTSFPLLATALFVVVRVLLGFLA